MFKVFLILSFLLLFPIETEAASGDVFIAKTKEGVDMKFRVLDETDKTCWVWREQGSGVPAISSSYHGSITIPNTVNGYSVIGIGEEAFSGCTGLKSVVIPNSITNIFSHAFYYCTSLNSISIPKNCDYIGYWAFASCYNLTDVLIPEGVTLIDGGAFLDCKNLSSIIIPSSVGRIGDGAFSRCTSLTNITLKEGLTYIGYDVFEGCTSLTNVIIPEGVNSIGQHVFKDCSNLESVTIPKSVANVGIGFQAFIGCSKLSLVISKMITSCKLAGDDVFEEIPDNSVLKVPLGYKDLYKEWSKWFDNIFESGKFHQLSISMSGNGVAHYDGNVIRNSSSSFNLEEGTPISISLSPDNGYQIKYLKYNGNIVSPLSTFSIQHITNDIKLEVYFERIPSEYSLIIKSIGNGSVSYNGTTVKNSSRTYSLEEGSSAKINFAPDNGYRLKNVKVNDADVTGSILNNQYTISNISKDTTVEVEFEAIPIPTYTLTITAKGNGAVSYNVNTVRNKSEDITVKEGTTVDILFSPDNGYYTNSIKVNGTDVTESIVDDKYTISNMMANTSVEVEFAEELKAFSSKRVNYVVKSLKGKTIVVTKGDYGKVVTVPAIVNYQDKDWKIVGIETNALADDDQLAAVIWNAEAPFTAMTSNPNLLLYVTDSSYAPSTVNNVVVNGTAESIKLAEADSGNNFYCPQEFTARSISYAHNYRMTTGIGEACGWETLALPFDVQQVTHESKGELIPFAKWKSGDVGKPFWLMELSSSGWRETDRIMANTPYIVSMPNNEKYKEEFLLNGKVTFSAENATVRKSEDVKTVQYEGRTFIPTFSEIGEGDGAYALNVSNDYETNVSGVADGSRFVLNLRRIHPFEAYMQSSAKTRAFDISDGMGIVTNNEKLMIKVYNLKGQMLKHREGTEEDIKKHLPKGLYIINGKKIIVR